MNKGASLVHGVAKEKNRTQWLNNNNAKPRTFPTVAAQSGSSNWINKYSIWSFPTEFTVPYLRVENSLYNLLFCDPTECMKTNLFLKFILLKCSRFGGFHSGSVVKNVCRAWATGDEGTIPWLGRSLEEGMATHSSILAWRIPWTEEPGRLPSIGLQRIEHDWSDFSTHAHIGDLQCWFVL